MRRGLIITVLISNLMMLEKGPGFIGVDDFGSRRGELLIDKGLVRHISPQENFYPHQPRVDGLPLLILQQSGFLNYHRMALVELTSTNTRK